MNGSLWRTVVKGVAVMVVLAIAAPMSAQQAQTQTAQGRRNNPGAGATADEKLVREGQSAFPQIFNPYRPIKIPQPVLENSPSVGQLTQDGKLMLSLEDAISLALENNLDIQVARYTPWIADTDILRTKSGGAGRGLAGTGTASALGSIPSLSFDPQLSSSYGWSRSSSPVNNPFLAGGGLLQTALTNYNSRGSLAYSQGFHTGTAYSVSFNANRSSTTSQSNFLNPAVSSSLFFTVTQNLLNGFGFLPNTRFIRIAKNNKKVADLSFAEQVILTVSSVQNLYWDLVFAREDVKVKTRSVELAEKLYNDNRRQVEIGTLAPIEVVRAEAEVARTRQDLIVAETFLLQQQTSMKNAITRNPLDPAIMNVEVVPTDVIQTNLEVPVVPIQDAVREAYEKRPDIRRSQIGLLNNELNVKATRNALLPTLSFVGQYGSQGLAGNGSNSVTTPTGLFAPNLSSPLVDADGNQILVGGVPAFSGLPILNTVVTPFTSGFGDSVWSTMQSEFPTYSVSFSLNIPIRNRSAQADSARAILEQRQAETGLRRLQNNVLVEVRNAQIALEQNKARVSAARKSRELAERTLDAEQKKYQLGASTIFFVIQAQRDLAQAESAEVRAYTDLTKARVEFERAVGRTLEVNRIDVPMPVATKDGKMVPAGTVLADIFGPRKF